MEISSLWIILFLSLLLVLLVMNFNFFRLMFKKRKSDFSWSDDDQKESISIDELLVPPPEFIFKIDNEKIENKCDWSVKYAIEVDATDAVGEWQFLKEASTEDKECARYEVIVSSTLQSREIPDETSTERQVHHSTFLTMFGWWETLLETLSRNLRFGDKYEGWLQLRAVDYFPQWGQSTMPPSHETTRDKKPGIPVRGQKEVHSSRMSFHETLSIRIKLEPGPKEDCFPRGFHEFWGTAASSAKAELNWRCAHPWHDNPLGTSCGSSAPSKSSGKNNVSTRVGGVVKCGIIPQLNYELIQDNDTEVKNAWNSSGLGGTITTDLAPQIGLSAGPLQLGTVSASIAPTYHNQSSKAEDSVAKKAVRGQRSGEELSLTIDTYFDTELELQSSKTDNYKSTVSISSTNEVVHHLRIIARTDEDAPCNCCKPHIELILGGHLVAGQPAAPSDAVLKIGAHQFSLSHPGWETGSGWAPAGEVRAWRITGNL